ncbi:MAG: nickel pincer cofactor biosynthesis protein LarC [Anaerolineae bacterium]
MGRRIAYVDCFSGASGDMLLGAMLDAGLSFDALQEDLALLGLQGYRLSLEKHLSHGISGSKFSVLDEGVGRPVTGLGAVRAIIEKSALPEEVRTASVRVFERLAAAEGRIHGISVEEVHFHEVGGVDTLVDIVGFCSGIQRLGIEAIYASALPAGGGTVHTEHGLLPVPAPATLALLAEVGAPILPAPAQGEMVTPTGAALLSTLATFRQPAMRVQHVGYGFGSKEFPWANMLRVWIGEEEAAPAGPATHGHTHSHEDTHGHEHPHEHEHSHEDQHPHEHEHAHAPADSGKG